jgi:protein regulator of cytokinesis 1
MLIQIEQECLDVYKKKVEQAAKSRAQLLEALSDARIELARLLSALGEKCFAGLVSSLHNSVLYILLKHL